MSFVRRMWTPLFRPALLCLSLTLSGAGVRGLAQIVHLTASPQVVPAGRPVVVIASLPPGSGGAVDFYDNGSLAATAPVTPDGNAILALGTLAPGMHLVGALPAGASFSSTGGLQVSVRVTAASSAFSLAAYPHAALAGEPIALDAWGLPADAAGTLHFFDNGTEVASTALTGTRMAGYESFGDSITAGAGTSSPLHSYPGIVGAQLGLATANHARNGAIACSIMADEILANGAGATQHNLPLSSVMIGTNDIDDFGGAPAHEPVYQNCLAGALAWLGVPREAKAIAGDAAAQAIDGAWTLNAGDADDGTHTLFNGSGSGTARFFLSSQGAPVYLWYLTRDDMAGQFTLTIDGKPTGKVYSTRVDRLAILKNVSFGFDRIPVAAGPHVFEIGIVSGSVGILGFGSPPLPGAGSVRPTVLVGDVPDTRQPDGPIQTPMLDRFAHLIRQELALLGRDGLDLRFVPTRGDMLGAPAEMRDFLHPNDLGEAHMANAFTRMFPLAAATIAGSATVSSASAGTHVFTAVYSGDGRYPGFTSDPVTVMLSEAATAVSLGASSLDPARNTPVTLVAHVGPEGMTGSITFTDTQAGAASSVLGSAAVDAAGTATLTLVLPVGPHSLTAVYSSDLWRPSAVSEPLTVTAHLVDEPTVTSLTAATSAAPYGTYATLTASVSNNAGVATDGVIAFLDGATPLATATLDQAGQARIFTPTLTAGVHSFSAAYAGNASFLASSGRAAPISIRFETTAVALNTAQTSYQVNDPITLIATVTPATATGQVEFWDSDRNLGTATLNAGGQAVFVTASLAVGLHDLHAIYSGDTYDGSAQGPSIPVKIVPRTTSLTLSTLPATAAYGTLGTLTAALGVSSATGAIAFTDTCTCQGQTQTVSLGQSPLAGGSAGVALGSLPVGLHTLTATYAGDAATNGATATASVEVTALVSRTALSASATTFGYGDTMTLSATVTPASASGSVSLREGAAELVRLPLRQGNVSWSSNAWSPGPHTVTAVYLGDATDAASTSPGVSLQVNRAATSIALAPLPQSMPVGSAVALTASVQPSAATGTVTLSSPDGRALGQATLANGTASLSLASLPAGHFACIALYGGDTNDEPSVSSAVGTEIVTLATSTTLSGVPATLPYGTPVTLLAAVGSAGSAAATGSVQFKDDTGALLGTAVLAGGAAAFPLPAKFAPGPHLVSAVYPGDGFYAGSSSAPAAITITPDTTSTELSVAQVQVPASGQVVFNARVAGIAQDIPTGTLQVVAGGRILASAPLSNGAPGVAYATIPVPAATLGLGRFQAAAFYSGDPVSTLSDSTAHPTAFEVVPTPVQAALSVSAASIPVNTPAILTAALTASAGSPTGSVDFFANGRPLGSAVVDPAGRASIAPASLALGSYALTAVYRPTGMFAASTTAAVSVAVTPPVAIALSASALTLSPGESSEIAITITPLSGFTGSVAGTCSTSVSYVRCTLAAPATAAGGPTQATLHIAVDKDTRTAQTTTLPLRGAAALALALSIPCLFVRRRHRRHPLSPDPVMLCLLAAAALALFGCGSGGNPYGIAASSETVHVAVAASGMTVGAEVAVTIKP